MFLVLEIINPMYLLVACCCFMIVVGCACYGCYDIVSEKSHEVVAAGGVVACDMSDCEIQEIHEQHLEDKGEGLWGKKAWGTDQDVCAGGRFDLEGGSLGIENGGLYLEGGGSFSLDDPVESPSFVSDPPEIALNLENECPGLDSSEPVGEEDINVESLPDTVSGKEEVESEAKVAVEGEGGGDVNTVNGTVNDPDNLENSVADLAGKSD